MTTTIVPDYAFKHPVGEPVCLHCHGPMPAGRAGLHCSDACDLAYQLGVARMLRPLTTRIMSHREKMAGKADQ